MSTQQTDLLAADNVQVGDVVIAMIDEWRDGTMSAFDCNVLIKSDLGVDVVYLSGHRSRNDFVDWVNVVAKVDKSKPVISVANDTFSGHFMAFEKLNATQIPETNNPNNGVSVPSRKI